MADNVTFGTPVATPPSGTVVATDDVGGAQYQRIKLVDGTDGATTPAKVTSEGNLQAITPNRTASGTLDADGEYVELDCDGISSITLIVQASTLNGGAFLDIAGWDGISTFSIPGTFSDGSFQSVITDPYDYQIVVIPCAGVGTVRVLLGNRSSGSITLTLEGGIGALVAVTQAFIASPTGAGASAQAVRVTDGGNALAVSAASLPLPTGAATSAKQDTEIASLSVIDDWDESDRAKVNPIVGQAGLQGGAGASTANTQRVAIATDANGVAGDVAHDAADSGKPVKIGGVAKGDTHTAVTDGDRVEAWFTAAGHQVVAGAWRGSLGDGVPDVDMVSDWASDGNTSGPSASAGHVFNGTSWDRQRGDTANGTDVDVTRLPALPAGTNNIGDVDVLSVPSPLSTAGNGTAATAHRVTLASDSTGQVAIASIAAGTTNIGDVDVLTVPSPLSTAGNGTAATAHRVTLASDSTGTVAATQSGTWNIERAAAAATSAVTSVAGSASSVTLLASNAARKGATVYNDSTALLYVKLGATASTSSFTVRMASQTYFEVPFGYTGVIDGIWASATGNSRLTELT